MASRKRRSRLAAGSICILASVLAALPGCMFLTAKGPLLVPLQRVSAAAGALTSPVLALLVPLEAQAWDGLDSLDKLDMPAFDLLTMLAGILLVVGIVGIARVPRVEHQEHQDFEAQDASLLRLEHLDPKCPVFSGTRVGGEEAPVVFLQAPPSEQLTKYLLDDPVGPFTGKLDWPDWLSSSPEKKEDSAVISGKWRQWDFQYSKREPFLLKADWHSVDGWGDELEIFVPRRDEMVPVRRAPPRVLALVEAFRDVNRACWEAIIDRLEKVKSESEDDILRLRLLNMIIEEFRERGHFGAIEVQAGPAFTRKEMQWHKDGATGLLHLGITLGGKRKLQLRARGSDDCWEQELSMAAGHVYLSSPFLFDHSVSYNAAANAGSGPILALMCRFGFLGEEDALWANHLRTRDMLEVAKAIADGLKTATDEGTLRMPTMQEVRNMEAAHSK